MPRVFAGGVPSPVFFVVVCAFPHTIVLQAPIHVVRFFVVNVNGVELPNGGGVVLHPMFPIVIGDVDPTIVSVDEVARAFRVYP